MQVRPSTSRRAFLRLSVLGSASAALLAACAAPPTPTPVPPPKPAAAPKPAAPAPTPTPAPAAKPAAPTPTAAPAPKPAAPTPTAAPAAKPATAAKGLSGKITYLHQDDPTLKVIRQGFVADFVKKFPDLQVEHIIAADLEQKRNALFAAGTPPDVFVPSGGSQNIAVYRDIALDLKPYVDRDSKELNLDDFFNKTLEFMKFKGKTLMWPNYPIVMVLAYNKELFDEAKVPYPTNDWTYEDVVKAGKPLTKKDSAGKPLQWGRVIDRAAYIGWMNALWAHGQPIFNDDVTKILLDSPKGIAALQWMYDTVYKDGIAPGPGQDLQGGFPGGKYAMEWGAHVAGWPGFRKANLKWDIVRLPKGPVSRGNRNALDTWTAAAQSKNPDAAWELIKFGSSYESGLKLANAGYAPYRKSVARDSWLKGTKGSRAVDPQNMEDYFVAMEESFHMPQVAFFWELTLKVIQPHFDLMWEKKKTPEQAAKDATVAANEFLRTQG
ncbi:MAG: sugar ABC transporter substrate-binding protein [Chloroflexi bacterium]|nr:sugar ABC transporter substrate-binding protein [Chloroflexota bacterium]